MLPNFLKDLGRKVIPLDTYMAACLNHYYSHKDAIGPQGDFITAPQVSQLFGEMLGVWFLDTWIEKNETRPFVYAELGPGRGTLLKDMHKTFQLRPSYLEQMTIYSVDINPTFQALQKEALSPTPLIHCKTIQELLQNIRPQPLYVMANEFFDTYAIKQYVFQKNTWWQRGVILEEEGTLKWELIPTHQPDIDFKLYPPLQEGDILELCPALMDDLRDLVAYIQRFGGALLAVDYGYHGYLWGDSFQALKDHQMVDPLHMPGECDLTAHVNFAYLQEIAGPQAIFENQGEFLLRMGIVQRAQKLITQNLDLQIPLMQGLERLIHPQHMGQLFKVLSIKA